MDNKPSFESKSLILAQQICDCPEVPNALANSSHPCSKVVRIQNAMVADDERSLPNSLLEDLIKQTFPFWQHSIIQQNPIFWFIVTMENIEVV